MGVGKLDDRHVEFDLTGAISVLPLSNGGTGNNNIVAESAGDDRAIVTDLTTLKLKPSATKASDIEKLIGLNLDTETVRTRLINSEAHTINTNIVHKQIHVPTPGIINKGSLVEVSQDVSGVTNGLTFLPKSDLMNYYEAFANGPAASYTFALTSPLNFKAHGIITVKGVLSNSGTVAVYDSVSQSLERDNTTVTNLNPFSFNFVIPNVNANTGLNIRLGKESGTNIGNIDLVGISISKLALTITWISV